MINSYFSSNTDTNASDKWCTWLAADTGSSVLMLLLSKYNASSELHQSLVVVVVVASVPVATTTTGGPVVTGPMATGRPATLP